MGNSTSSQRKTSSERHGRSSRSNRRSSREHASDSNADVAARVQKVARDTSRQIQNSIKKLEENDHPAAQLLDTLCGPYIDGDDNSRYGTAASFYSEDVSESDSRTLSEDETTTTTTDLRRRKHEDRATDRSVDTSSYLSQSDFEESVKETRRRKSRKQDKSRSRNSRSSSEGSEEDSEYAGVVTQVEEIGHGLQKPLASSFAKRCYFTKAGIGKTTQHYEGLTLTGNVVLMLASSMKLKGCPTICDEDLRRVEQTYPNQFSRLPDELLLSSGWRRISKYCHFSYKPIPDGIPFFHSKQRLHSAGGYYFLLASAVGMVRPIDVEPLTRDTLVLLETDFPTSCDAAPDVLINDPEQWTLVDKFCFFSGGPINAEEDVYYQADFDGNPIFMLAFLSPSLTPAELYKLDSGKGDPGLKSMMAVEEVESVYDLTERDFQDLKLYHLGPCRALPQYILEPQAWTKVLPPHFLAARQEATLRVHDYEIKMNPHGHEGDLHESVRSDSAGFAEDTIFTEQGVYTEQGEESYNDEQLYSPQQQYILNEQLYEQQPPPLNNYEPHVQEQQDSSAYQQETFGMRRNVHDQLQGGTQQASPQREAEEEGAFFDSAVPMDEAMAAHSHNAMPNQRRPRMDPPEDQPPSLSNSGAGQNTVEPKEVEYYSNDHDAEEVAESDYFANERERNAENNYFRQEQNSEDFHHHGAANNEFFVNENEGANDAYYETEQIRNDEYYGNDHGVVDNEYYSEEQVAAENNEDFPGEQDAVEDQYFEEGECYSRENEKQDEYYDRDSNFCDVPADGNPENPISRVEGASEGEAAFPTEQNAGNAPDLSQHQSPDVAQDRLPPASPRESDYTQSSAMRGAQELLRRNRQRRLEKANEESADPSVLSSPPIGSDSGTWDSGSDFTSVFSGNSGWTDNSANPDRSSRRALILQMAKARMKNNKHVGGSPANNNIDKRTSVIAEEPHENYEEEKKLEMHQEFTADIDLTEDLD